MHGFIRFKRGRLSAAVLLLVVLGILSVGAALAAVSLEHFEGEWPEPDRAVLTFGTGSEINHAGFHVWRSETNIAPGNVNSTTATRLTTNLIIGNPCQAVGFEYQYDDTTVDPTKEKYYYYLESISCSTSESEFFGSTDDPESGLEVTNPNPSEPTFYLYLPITRRGSDVPTE